MKDKMDWICFGDSAKGLLACAKHEIDPGNSLEQLISLNDDLSVGDISDLENRDKRALGVCPWKDDPEVSDGAEEFIERYFTKSLPAFFETTQPVIWYGDSAFEQCGMLRAAHDLYTRGVSFSLVHVDQLKGEELPPPEPRSDDGPMGIILDENHKILTSVLKILPQPILQPVLRHMVHRFRQKRWRSQRASMVVFRGVGELEPETAKIFYSRQRAVKDCEAKLLYTRWEQLVRENAPLRVMEGGKLISAPIDYYDQAILVNTQQNETPAALVIGRTLGEYAVSDYFIFERIRALAAAGKLEIVKDGANYRDTTVKKRE